MTTISSELDLSGHRLGFADEFDVLGVSSTAGTGATWYAHTPWGIDFGSACFAKPVAVHTTDTVGWLTYHNEAAFTLRDRRPPPGDARWCGSWRLHRPDDMQPPHEECSMAVAFKENRPVRGVEAIAERPDGGHLPFTAYPTPLRDETGALITTVNVLVDINERKVVNAVLAGSEAYPRLTLKAGLSAFWEIDVLRSHRSTLPAGPWRRTAPGAALTGRPRSVPSASRSASGPWTQAARMRPQPSTRCTGSWLARASGLTWTTPAVHQGNLDAGRAFLPPASRAAAY